MSERPRGKKGRGENPPRQDTEEERNLKAAAEYQARQNAVSKGDDLVDEIIKEMDSVSRRKGADVEAERKTKKEDVILPETTPEGDEIRKERIAQDKSAAIKLEEEKTHKEALALLKKTKKDRGSRKAQAEMEAEQDAQIELLSPEELQQKFAEVTEANKATDFNFASRIQARIEKLETEAHKHEEGRPDAVGAVTNDLDFGLKPSIETEEPSKKAWLDAIGSAARKDAPANVEPPIKGEWPVVNSVHIPPAEFIDVGDSETPLDPNLSEKEISANSRQAMYIEIDKKSQAAKDEKAKAVSTSAQKSSDMEERVAKFTDTFKREQARIAAEKSEAGFESLRTMETPRESLSPEMLKVLEETEREEIDKKSEAEKDEKAKARALAAALKGPPEKVSKGPEVPAILKRPIKAGETEQEWIDRTHAAETGSKTEYPASTEKRAWLDEVGTFGTDARSGAVETPFVVNPEEVPEYVKERLNDSTRAEGHGLLKRLVESAKGKLYEVGEKVSESFTNSKEYLNNRAKEIDASAEASGLEKWTRWVGEKYNKLSPIHKLGVGVSLGVGTAVAASFASPFALLGLGGLVLQRGAGAASMFISIEKKLQEKKMGESYQFIATKERAAIDAMLYTAVMGTAIHQGLDWAREHAVVERTQELLKNLFGHTSSTSVPGGSAPGAIHHGPLQAPAAAALPARGIEMPTVGASSHGYEGMLKDLIKQLPDKPPAGITPKIDGSDIEKLFYAKLHPENISGAIHRLALDHNFVGKDGSALIEKGIQTHMTIVNGQIQFTDAKHVAGMFNAASDMRVTPSIHTEVSAASGSSEVLGQPVSLPEATASPAAPLIETTDANTVAQGQTVHTAEAPEMPETQPPAPVVEHSFVYNKFDVRIPVAESHIYAAPGDKDLLVFGGSPQEKMDKIVEFLTKNPDKVIYNASDDNKYRLMWRMVSGKVEMVGAARTSGFLGFFSDFMKPPEVNELAKIIE